MFCVDTETTGTDFHHGAKPYFVTICDDTGKQTWYEWAVDPYSRNPIIPKKDILEIRQLLKTCANWSKFDEETRERHCIVGQNLKFDAHALDTIDIHDFPWEMHNDTLTIAHLLGSNQPKDLTSLAATWLGSNIQPIEDRMKHAVMECRHRVQQSRLKVKRQKQKGNLFKDDFWIKQEPLAFWAIAEEGQEQMPSAKGSSNKKPEEQTWKFDTWLPRAMAFHLKLLADHHYWHVTREYANADSATTMLLWPVLKAECVRQGLWPIYREMKKLNGILKEGMEDYGVTFNKQRACQQRAEYEASCEKAAAICISLSEGRLEEMPKGVSNGLRETVFDVLGLESTRQTKKGNDSMDKYQLEEWVQTLPPGSKGLLFVKNLQRFRKRQTALGYIDAYERFAIDEDKELVELQRRLQEHPDDVALRNAVHDRLEEGSLSNYARLYSSYNATGSDTLRMSNGSPNLQQVSKQEIAEEGQETHNARWMFGPLPGREWWKADYENLELKIPGYEAPEPAMIDLFENPKKGPYFGSYHLLNASTAYPDLFELPICPKCLSRGCRDEEGKKMPCQPKVPTCEIKGAFKELHEATWYQWIKNCVPMNTLALTRQGWKTYDEIQVGDEVLGHDYETIGEEDDVFCLRRRVLKWVPVLEKFKFEDAPLVKMENEHFSTVSTPNHKWIGRRRRWDKKYRDEVFTTKQVDGQREIYTTAMVSDESLLNITDEEAEIIGFVYGDGSIQKSEKGYGPSRRLDGSKIGFRVTIHQKKERGVEYIEDLLKRWGGDFKKYYREDRGTHHWVLDPEKCRSIWQRAGLWDEEDMEAFVLKLGESQRRAYLEAVWQAEGHEDEYGARLYTQCVGSFAESIRLAIFMTGKFPTSHLNTPTELTRNDCLTFRACKSHVTGQRLKKTDVGKGDVWCIRTPTGSWVMRQGDQITLTGNSGFALIYGCQEKKFDQTAHKKGAYRAIKERLPALFRLADHWIRYAERHGYIETLRDKTLDCKRGYPILTSRSEWGNVSPTVPLNYHVQSTAMWCTRKAMIRCEEQLRQWRKKGFDGWMIMQVHDELVFDFPAVGDPRAESEKVGLTKKSNLWRARRMQELMCESGRDIGIPLTTSLAWCKDNWGEGIGM